MRILAISVLALFAAVAAEGMTVRSKGDLRLWQTVFDRSAPLSWNWEAGADAATVSLREIRSTEDGGGGAVATLYGRPSVVEVVRSPVDSRRGSCVVTPWTPSAATTPSPEQVFAALFEVTLVQTSNFVEVARSEAYLAYPPGAVARAEGGGALVTPTITVQAKESRAWRRAVDPRASGYDAAWWNAEGASGYEVLWRRPSGWYDVERVFGGAGAVDGARLRFGKFGFAVRLR